jgi:hypothetical protein
MPDLSGSFRERLQEVRVLLLLPDVMLTSRLRSLKVHLYC